MYRCLIINNPFITRKTTFKVKGLLFLHLTKTDCGGSIDQYLMSIGATPFPSQLTMTRAFVPTTAFYCYDSFNDHRPSSIT